MKIDIVKLVPNTAALQALADRNYGAFRTLSSHIAEALDDHDVSPLYHLKTYGSAPEGVKHLCDCVVDDMLEDIEDLGVKWKNLRAVVRDLVFLIATTADFEADTPCPPSPQLQAPVGRLPLGPLPQARVPSGPLSPSHLASNPLAPFHTVTPSVSSAPSSSEPTSAPSEGHGGVRKILQRIFQLIYNDNERGYKQFLRKPIARRIGTGLMRTIATNKALKALCDGQLFTNKQALLELRNGKDPREYHGAGWYADLVTDDFDEAYIKIYIGQADDVGRRVRQHLTDYLTKDTLHYSVLRKPGRRSNYVLLGQFRAPNHGKEDVDMVLNIGEMMWALAFQTLPTPTLKRYLPEDVPIRTPSIGLNVATPLSQGHHRAHQSFTLLHCSTDPEARAYYQAVVAKRNMATHTTLRAQGYLPTIVGTRKRSQWTAHYNGPDTDKGQVTRVQVYCSSCEDLEKAIWDPAPLYNDDGISLARQMVCEKGHPRVDWVPTDREMLIISQRAYRDQVRNAMGH